MEKSKRDIHIQTLKEWYVSCVRPLSALKKDLVNIQPYRGETQDIWFIRKLLNLSQKELADILYVSRQAVSSWETGSRSMNSFSKDLFCKFALETLEKYSIELRRRIKI